MQVSEKTMEVNKKKEVSLEEISKTVEQINNVIKEKKGKLAPLIKELRQVCHHLCDDTITLLNHEWHTDLTQLLQYLEVLVDANV